jgi:hypothetical protein
MSNHYFPLPHALRTLVYRMRRSARRAWRLMERSASHSGWVYGQQSRRAYGATMTNLWNGAARRAMVRTAMADGLPIREAVRLARQIGGTIKKP